MIQPDLRQLRYFLAVAEELHFARAAERVGIAQPPLTQQIQKLERMLGCRLLVRGRRTRLTPAGEALSEDARRLLAQAEDAFERTRRVARGEAGRLRVGVPPSVMLTELPEAVRRFRERHPDVSFTLLEMATSAIETELRAGRIDLGFLREAQPPHAELLFREPMMAVLPASHALARRPSVRLRDLAGDAFVFFPERVGPAFHRRLIEACVAAGFSPNVVQEATQWPTVVSLVEAGMGVTLAPACVARFRRKGVVFRPVPGLRTSVYAACSEEARSAAADAFLKLSQRAIVRAAQ